MDLGEAERGGFPRKLFKLLDHDNDGRITPAEFKSFQREQRRLRRRVRVLDPSPLVFLFSAGHASQVMCGVPLTPDTTTHGHCSNPTNPRLLKRVHLGQVERACRLDRRVVGQTSRTDMLGGNPPILRRPSIGCTRLQGIEMIYGSSGLGVCIFNKRCIEGYIDSTNSVSVSEFALRNRANEKDLVPV
jgi:hypothetical protein